MKLIECESNGDRSKTLSAEEYLNKIRPFLKFLWFLKDIINTLKKYDTWEIQLTKAINFISSIDNYEERVMHSKRDKIEIMINDEANEVIKNLYYKYHKINPNFGASNIDSPDWITNKKTAINPMNKKDN